MLKAYTNATVFTGEKLYDNVAVVTKGTIVEDIIAPHQLPADIHIIDCSGQLLTPAFIDLQIYGAENKLFSAYPTVESLEILANWNMQNGTRLCLPTIATQPMDVIYKCIDAIKSYQQKGGKGIAGLHLEGPFICTEKKGAHVEKWIHSPDMDEIQALIKKAEGTIKMITLAPEMANDEIIHVLQKNGIVISIGHSNASFYEAIHAMNKGAVITHLFNAMRPFHHREPGIVGAAFQHDSAMASIIADGIHVHYESIKIAKHMMGERLFFITDAVTQTSAGSYMHQINNNHYVLPDGTLSGSALTMLQAIQNAIRHCDIALEEALRMAALYPARAMGWQHVGKIEKGYDAKLCLLEKDLSTITAVF